ncbi:hypothetical protein GB931_14820 [Modestobacter sp. I12A-02628]|uniref:DUF559 domain-containing protein n=1 Tax=Goekera deserti TaxID=2497753 RepID=A0A7K3WAG4_9ACTN|nr:hypothetical protein [Goekera deserti]MPQ99170.1 hypothetical protein [Goekera deserti]NDI47505.1 hypothetical protein [Goekera deserti]NEL53316.1 hypothetical protein [Goekera deserti]
MESPRPWSAAAARAAGTSRSRRRGIEHVRLAHDVRVPLTDAVDRVELLGLLASALPADAAFSHDTAAALLGAPVDLPARPQIALTPRRVLPQHGWVDVHARALTDVDVVAAGGLRVTSGAQTFLDLAARLPAAELTAVGDALMRRGHLTADHLTERLMRAGRVRGVVRARAVAPLLTPLAQSRPESLMRYWLLASDLPTPEPQVPVHDRSGRVVAHGDLGYREWRTLLEYEGRQHADAEQFDRDVDRYSLMATGDWLVLRFSRRHLRGPHVVVARTRAVLLNRGWRPGPPS